MIPRNRTTKPGATVIESDTVAYRLLRARDSMTGKVEGDKEFGFYLVGKGKS